MTTLLKRSYCYPDGTLYLDDISPNDAIPTAITIGVTVDLQDFGVCSGMAWVEELMVTPLPRWAAILLFWCLNPQKINMVCVSVQSEAQNIEFEFELDTSKSVHDNLLASPKSLGIKDVWIHVDS